MIRECFKTFSGIIFDAHMLKHEVGLDVDSLDKAPSPLAPEAHHLDKAKSVELKGFKFSSIPRGIFSGLSFPFRWVGGKLSNLRLHKSPHVVFSLDLPRFVYEGEAEEELKDALSPIYDQLKVHWYWTMMEWIPCESPPPTRAHQRQ
jgi:hypothetical protein